MEQLLSRGISVRAIVHSTRKLPAGAAENSNATVVEASLLSLRDEDLQRHLRGCDAVISCLGHVISVKGVFGPPHDLVTEATTRLCRGIEALQPAVPVKFILMSSVSVIHPGGLDTRRGTFEKAFVWILRGVLPPAKDNQRAADFLYENIGAGNPFVQWAAVRPDTLLEGDVSEYTLHEGLVSGLERVRARRPARLRPFIVAVASWCRVHRHEEYVWLSVICCSDSFVMLTEASGAKR